MPAALMPAAFRTLSAPTLAALAVVGALGLAAPAGPAAAAASCAAERQAELDQEDRDMPVILQVVAEIDARGLPALNAHVDDLAAVLSHAPASELAPCDGTVYRRLEGARYPTPEISRAAAALQAAEPGVKVVVVGLSPYPLAAGLLGAAYGARGAWDKADRAMQPGLRLGPLDERLVTQETLALARLGRPGEGVALCDRFLRERPDLSPSVHALILRTRGFALGEAGRLDEAIAAVQDSLKLEPGNALAREEITRLTLRKSGRPASGPELGPGPAPNAAPTDRPPA